MARIRFLQRVNLICKACYRILAKLNIATKSHLVANPLCSSLSPRSTVHQCSFIRLLNADYVMIDIPSKNRNSYTYHIQRLTCKEFQRRKPRLSCPRGPSRFYSISGLLRIAWHFGNQIGRAHV